MASINKFKPVAWMGQRISELLGQGARHVVSFLWRWRRHSLTPTRDLNQVDYEFYDRARRGMEAGLEISGLFLKPLASKIAAWTMGKPLSFKANPTPPRTQGGNFEASEVAINDWWSKNHADILKTLEESVSLGDCYVVVNPDLSASVVAPDVVTPIVDENDFSRQLGWRITQRYPHPIETGRSMLIIDDYTATERVRTISMDGKPDDVQRYRNLIGIVPVIHVPNNKGVNEMFGHPECEPLVISKNGVLHRYGEVLDAALDGNVKQGRPVPTFELNDTNALQKFYEQYATTESEEDPETGETVQKTYLDFTSDDVVALVGKFKFESPGSFAKDTEILLGLLFYMLLQHTEIPEFIWGNAIASSKASAESQLPPFVKWIEKKRGQVSKWVMELVTVVNRLQALTMPGVQVVDFSIQWDSLTEDDGKLRFEIVKWALAEGLITKARALELAPALEIDDPAGEVEAAQDEQDQQHEEDEQRFMDQRAAMVQQSGGESDTDPLEGEDNLRLANAA
jgi:hypothetical protein